jgi:hemerythrin
MNKNQMNTFYWDRNFETGLDDVDDQHQKLVNLINRFGELLFQQENTSIADIETVLGELVAYTQYHFSEEEKMMETQGLDPAFIEHHIQLHLEFLQEVQKMQTGILQRNVSTAQPMMKYLVHWLAFHILGVDQSMSRQVKAIQSGQKASDIYSIEFGISQNVTLPLLRAIDSLSQKVSDQNQDLIELNRSLETKVRDRTNALSEANHLLEEIALTDILTGLPNRRHAMARLAKEWTQSVTKTAPLSCMMVDADGFKQINDSFGHDAGDEVLKQLSRQLSHSVRSDDAVCRLGGDEFLIICPHTNLQGALQAAEQMRHAVSSLRVPAGTGHWSGSISVGVATRNEDMVSPEDLIKAADEGVYIAKQKGRNRVASRTFDIE